MADAIRKHNLNDKVTIIEHDSNISANNDVIGFINNFYHEFQTVIKLNEDEMAKFDHIELAVEWIPKLTARVYPKKH